MPTLQISALCPENRAEDSNTDLQPRLCVLDGRNRVSRGRGGKRGKETGQARGGAGSTYQVAPGHWDCVAVTL